MVSLQQQSAYSRAPFSNLLQGRPCMLLSWPSRRTLTAGAGAPLGLVGLRQRLAGVGIGDEAVGRHRRGLVVAALVVLQAQRDLSVYQLHAG